MNLIGVCLRLACFLILAGTPILLTLRWRRRLLAAQGRAEATTGWFAFQRSTQWLSTGFWFAWLGAVLLLDPWRELARAMHWSWLAGLALHNAMTVLPPALLLATCDTMTYPVLRLVRGIELSKREVALDAFFGRLWLMLPAAFIWTGVKGAPIQGTKPEALIPLTFMAVGVLSLVFIQGFWLRRRLKQTFTPHSVTMGVLRGRAFALAEKAGVKLNQIYVFPMAKWRLANAYASEGNNLMLTDWLLRHLNTREVDAVIGHELAHMKQSHLSKLTWLTVLLWIAPIAWLRMRNTFPDLAWTAIWLLGSWHLAAWISTALGRRYERQADLQGIAISGDPEAFISGLMRIDQLNLMPHELGSIEENLSTHPSTRKRIEAIRKAAGLSEQSVEAMKSRVAADSGSYTLPEAKLSEPAIPPPKADGYRLPDSVEAAVHGDAPVFDSTFKYGGSHRFTMLYVLSIGLAPVGIAKMLILFPDPTARFVISSPGVLLYAGLILFVMDVGARSGLRKLRPKIAARLFGSANAVESNAVFVGLAPGDKIRTYEGSEHWDLGFLVPEGERLCFIGEQTRFALARSQIRGIRIGRGMPNWLPSRFIYVDWSDPETNSSGTFNLACVGTNSFWVDGRKSVQFAAKLQQWLSAPGLLEATTHGNLPLPQFSEVTSKSITASFRRSQFLASGVVVLVPGVTVMIMTGMLQENLTLCVVAALGAFAGHAFAAIPSWRYGES